MAKLGYRDDGLRYDGGLELDFDTSTPDQTQQQASTALADTSITGEISPEAFTADQNDFTLSNGHSFRLSTNGVARTITGFANVKGGRTVYIHNVAGGANISLANDSASSTTEYRILTGTGGTVAIQPDRSAILQYDSISKRWRLIAYT
jgi:hypothetical protein